MNDGDIKQALKKLNVLNNEKTHFELNKRKIIELEKLDIVKKYIELINVIEKYAGINFSKIEAKNFDEKKRVRLIKQKIHLDQTKERVRKLEDIKEVKEYIRAKRIVEVYEKKDFSKEATVYDAYSGFAKRTKSSNNIMVFIGEAEEDEKKYFEYWDLETIDTIFVPENENESFKKKNKVMLFNLNDRNEIEFKYFKLRKKFLIDLYDNGQDTAVDKVTKGR